MPTPKDDGHLLEVWKNLEREYISAGLSRYGAHKRIAGEYSITPTTVYCWLTPKHRRYKLEYDKSEKSKKKRRERAKMPENRARISHYQRIGRNLPSVIEDLYLESGTSTMSLEGIAEMLKQKTSFKFGKVKILEAIARYNLEHEERPMVEIESELYKIDL